MVIVVYAKSIIIIALETAGYLLYSYRYSRLAGDKMW